jgi:hypothetical protein
MSVVLEERSNKEGEALANAPRGNKYTYLGAQDFVIR